MVNSPAEIIDLEKINLGDHAVLFYKEEINMLNTAAVFIKNSLENNEICLFIDTAPMHKKIIKILKVLIDDLEYYLDSKQLLLLTKEESYGDPAEFDSDAMINLIITEVKKAKKDGYQGLSITGELKGVVDFSGGKEEVIKYEWKLHDKVFKKYPVSALCRYNLNQFDQEVIKAAIELHDYIVWEGRLNDNPYYIDPEGYEENKVEEYEIKSWLENIDQYQKKEKNYKRVIDRTRESSKEFTHNSKKLFTAFYNIASSFYKLKEYNSLQNNFTKEIISSTIKMLEMYDLYTRGHSENVAELAVKIAEEMDLPKPEVESVYWSGLVHDIGKLLIPLEILNKEGKLTKSEYEVIKEHLVLGSNALSSSSSLKKIAKYVRHHHERWDGKGYPKGLSESEIPLVSQILCAADAWDAMRSKRTYRDSLSYEQALSEIRKNKGSQFAPKIVESMLKVIEN